MYWRAKYYMYTKITPSFHQKQTVAPHKSRIMFIWFSMLGKSPKCSPRIPWLRRSGWPGERSNRTSCSPSRGSRRSGGRLAGRPWRRGQPRHPWWRLARNVREPENPSRDEIPKWLPVNNPWTQFIQGKILDNVLRLNSSRNFNFRALNRSKQVMCKEIQHQMRKIISQGEIIRKHLEIIKVWV